MTLRRIITRVIVFLLLGAIVNVAVAWGFAGKLAGARRDMAFSWTDALDYAGVERDCIPFRIDGSRSGMVLRSVGSHVIMVYGMAQDGRVPRVTEVRFGWPITSVYYRRWNAGFLGHLRDRLSGGWQIDQGRGALPLRPIWPGFAINTIFYAATLWMLFAAPGFVRRRIRRFRERCIYCGYDLRGQPPPQDGDSIRCPECGRSSPLPRGEGAGVRAYTT